MPTKYLILRTSMPVDESFAPSSTRSWRTSKGDKAELAIQTVDGHEHDVGDLRADPQNVAVMDAEV